MKNIKKRLGCHASCRPNDSGLFLICSQCGNSEPFDELIEAAQGVMEAFDGYQDMTNGQARARVVRLRGAINKAIGQ